MKAILDGIVLAESDKTVIVEGNHYFPPESVHQSYFSESEHRTICPWKGVAYYYHVTVNGEQKSNAAWYYPDTKERAKKFEGYVAFYPERGVKVVEM